MIVEAKRGYFLIPGRLERARVARKYLDNLEDITHKYTAPIQTKQAAGEIASRNDLPQLQTPLENFLEAASKDRDTKGLVLEEFAKNLAGLWISVIVFLDQTNSRSLKVQKGKLPPIDNALHEFKHNARVGCFDTDAFFCHVFNKEAFEEAVVAYQKQQVHGFAVFPDLELPKAFSVVKFQH